ncbi:MAG TPA: ACP S-malonyltransferase [Victivallales bacterium]|nr:ACP S-malonyltransferase [Victivallales bacterium]
MKTAFVFSGQGAQKVGMGKDLFENSPVAAEVFKKADEILGYSLSDICFNGPDSKLTETKYCQLAIYVMSAACLEAFKEKHGDMTPVATAGLSLGEFTALYAAGAFSFEDGVKIIEKRAIYMQEACDNTKGGMASVLRGETTLIEESCNEAGIDVSNFNSPGQTVISGEKEKVKNAISILKSKGISKIIPLRVAGAYHSRLMKSAEVKLEEYLNNFDFTIPAIPVAQNYVGALTAEPNQIKTNIIKQVTGSVQWVDCINSFDSLGVDNIIEFGPGNVLTGLIKRINSNISLSNINSVETLNNFNQ